MSSYGEKVSTCTALADIIRLLWILWKSTQHLMITLTENKHTMVLLYVFYIIHWELCWQIIDNSSILCLFSVNSDHWMLRSIFTELHSDLIMSAMAGYVRAYMYIDLFDWLFLVFGYEIYMRFYLASKTFKQSFASTNKMFCVDHLGKKTHYTMHRSWIILE